MLSKVSPSAFCSYRKMLDARKSIKERGLFRVAESGMLTNLVTTAAEFLQRVLFCFSSWQKVGKLVGTCEKGSTQAWPGFIMVCSFGS